MVAPLVTPNSAPAQRTPQTHTPSAVLPLSWTVRPMPALPPRRPSSPPNAPIAIQHVLPFEKPGVETTIADTPCQAMGEDYILCAKLLRLVAETCLGMRSPQQSIRWTNRKAYEQLQRRHLRAQVVLRTSPHPPAIVTTGAIRAQKVSERVLEASAIVVSQAKTGTCTYRALAIKVVEHNGDWWVTDIEI